MGYGNGSAGASVANQESYAAKSVQRVPDVSRRMEMLEKQTSDLHGIISDLEIRLQAVTMPDAPQPANINKPMDQPSVPLASALFSASDRLDAAMDRLRSLLGRIEV